MFLSLAFLLGGVYQSYGQYKSNLDAPGSCATVNAIVCLSSGSDTPLNPIAGKMYNYSVSIPNFLSSTSLEYKWFVTTSQTFISTTADVSSIVATIEANDGTGPHILATGNGYNNVSTGANNIDISWKSWTNDPANPVFLVIYVTENGVCLTDNIEVYLINPVNAFTLDIANIDQAGGIQGANFATCVSPIRSATWVPGTTNPPGQLNVDYGTNYLYFSVTAANWANAWRPSAQITAATMGARTVSVDWAYAASANSSNPADWHAMPLSGSTYVSTANVVNQNIDGNNDNFVGSAGECIVIRVTIDHNTEETLVDLPVELAVDGVMMREGTTAGVFDVVGQGDVHYSDIAPIANTDCGKEDLFKYDIATQIITRRPEVHDETDPDPDQNYVRPKIGS